MGNTWPSCQPMIFCMFNRILINLSNLDHHDIMELQRVSYPISVPCSSSDQSQPEIVDI